MKELLKQIDTSTFTSEFEVMLYEDLMVYPEKRWTPWGDLDLYDTVLMVHDILDRKHSWGNAKECNYGIMFKVLYQLLDNLCDWNQVTVKSKSVDNIKSLMKRLQHQMNGEENDQ